MREYTVQALRLKLEAEGYGSDAIEAVLADLCACGELDDERYIEVYAHGRSARGYGPRYIQHRLTQRGIDPELLASCWPTLGIDWDQIVAALYQKKYPTPPVSLKEKAARQRFLQQRGFDMTHIRSLQMDIVNADEA